MATEFVFNEIEKAIKLDPSLLQKVGGVLHFKIGTENWTIDLKNAPGSVSKSAPAKADCTVTVDEENFVNMMTGKANGQQLFMQGKLKLAGNMSLAMKLDKLPKAPAPSTAASTPAPAAAPSSSSSSGSFRAAAVFDELTKKIAANPGLVQQIAGVYHFQINGPGGVTKSWTVDLKNGKGSVAEGKPEKADVTLVTGDEDFVNMMTGKANSQQLFMQGKLKIQGNMAFAMKLNKLQAAKASL